jgi:polar amino acid transport system substrate-binding protein
MVASGSAGKLQKQLAAESTIEKILKRGVLRVGMSTFLPWAMKDKKGSFVGFEIDVATRLAEDTGVKVEFIPTKWDGIIPALLTGKFDVIIGGMTIRSDRNLKVNFSIPYDYSGQTICAHKKLAAGFKGPEDFNRPDVTVGARLGSTSVPAMKRMMPKAKLRLFSEEPQLYQDIRTPCLQSRNHSRASSLALLSAKVTLTPSITLTAGFGPLRRKAGYKSGTTTGLTLESGRVLFNRRRHGAAGRGTMHIEHLSIIIWHYT